MNKAVFLDRDGVLNREIGDYVCRPADFELMPDIPQVLAELKKRGYLLIVITNQGGISKGLYTHEILSNIHQLMIDELAVEDVVLDAIYYCPHHPEVNTNCICRKPGSLMLEKAMARFNIDPSKSYFIGDHERDVHAGERAGVTSIKIESNTPLMNILGQIA